MAGTTKKKTQNSQKIFAQKLTTVNKILEKLENEVEKAMSQIKKSSEKSSQLIKKNFDDIVEKISTSNLYSSASEKTEEIISEVRRVADDIVNKVKKLDLKLAEQMLTDVRENMDQLVERFQSTEIAQLAKDKAHVAKNQILHVLKIPTQDEMDQLNKKVVSLEKKIKTLSQRKQAA